jgi:hypothetical protein
MKEIALIFIAIIISGVAILSTLFFSSIGLATTNTTTIAVNVSSVGQLSVTPSYLEWIQIAPGGQGTDQTITITNTGSIDFTTGLYASVNSFSAEASNPIGGASTAYAAGSYLVLKNASDTVYHFANRMEWNDSTIVGSISGKNANGISWGKYRNLTNYWIWELRKDNNNQCLNTTTGTPNTAALTIINTQGTFDLTGSTTSATPVGNTSEWGIWSFSAGPLADYCVAVRKNCQSFMIYRWDYNSSLTACTTRKYLNNSLSVGQSIIVTANVFIPSGTPAGNATQSTLTFTAT